VVCRREIVSVLPSITVGVLMLRFVAALGVQACGDQIAREKETLCHQIDLILLEGSPSRQFAS
jgi:hypothetical protein